MERDRGNYKENRTREIKAEYIEFSGHHREHRKDCLKGRFIHSTELCKLSYPVEHHQVGSNKLSSPGTKTHKDNRNSTLGGTVFPPNSQALQHKKEKSASRKLTVQAGYTFETNSLLFRPEPTRASRTTRLCDNTSSPNSAAGPWNGREPSPRTCENNGRSPTAMSTASQLFHVGGGGANRKVPCMFWTLMGSPWKVSRTL